MKLWIIVDGVIVMAVDCVAKKKYAQIRRKRESKKEKIKSYRGKNWVQVITTTEIYIHKGETIVKTEERK